MPRPTLVVDASVAIKWILPENGQQEALRIQDKYQDEEIDLIAPYLLAAEVANVLWKHESRGDLDALTARRAFLQFLRDSPLLVNSATISTAALGLALAHHRPVYDCLYLACALEQQCDLVTADERFFNALHMSFPCIQLLKNVQL